MVERHPSDEAYQAALVYDSVVVPRYAGLFAQQLIQRVKIPPRGNVLDLSCRTGFPAVQLLPTLADGRIIAVDHDPVYLELARQRAGHEVGRRFFLKEENVESLSFANAVFSNVVGNLVDRTTTDRAALLSEIARVLKPGGQMVITMPLSGSFAEVLDMFREICLKHELTDVARRVEQYAQSMPSQQSWAEEITSHGFENVVIDVQSYTLAFESGAHLLTDPAMYVAAMPEWQWCAAGVEDVPSVLYSVQDTIDVYFRGRAFPVTVVAGCATAYRPRS
jgi:ubiquinone/menaquinone biosynthesis C-methylase UbiE